MKRITLTLAALLLSGCAIAPNPLPVGDYGLHIRESETLREEYRALGGTAPRIFGFAMAYPEGCEIWLLPTATIDELAHELEHCEEGDRHE